MRAASACARAAARRPRPATRLHCRLLVRAFGDAVDPSKWPAVNGLAAKQDDEGATVAHFRGTLTAGATGHPLRADDEHESFDLEFTASRLGFPAYEPQDEEQDEHHIREETREDATAKAERILAILRHSMTELDIGRVIHRISQFATTPRVTLQTRKQFLKSLEGRFGPDHEREHELVVDFLLGKDQVIDQLKDESRDTMDVLAGSSSSSAAAQGDELGEREVLVPEIMGLHPELVADPKFIGVVFCYCRMACLNSQKLVRPPNGQHRHPKSSLLQVKHDFRRVLDSEGLSHYAEMMGIKNEAREDDEEVDAIDAEWEEFNLENDRIDFRMLVAKTQELIALMKLELSDDTITKMLIAMLASLKTTKLHRKIFQEMVCNIQAALPERSHEAVLRQLVPFLSGNQATYDDFESDIASTALNHHRSRHEAILRALLETRMRLGHILIHDLDAIDPMASISPKLAPEVREKVITTAWNIVSVLNDREYHVFFSRFLKHKLAWRPSRATFGQTFLDDVRKSLGPRKADVIMPLFEEVFPHLSVETLTICRVKLRHSRKLLREAATVSAVNDLGRGRLEKAWRADRSVFYRNLPFGVTEKHLRASLDHIGRVKRFVLFSSPVSGPPDEIEDDEVTDSEAVASMGSDEDEDEEIESFSAVEEEEDEEEDEDLNDDVIAALIKKLGPKDKRSLQRELKTPRKKDHVIASDAKSSYNVVVEFESTSSRDRALQQSLQIFGVMMGGWKEYRPVFSSPSEERASVSVHNIPFGTSIDSLMTEMNAILHKEGLAVDLSTKLPRGVVVASGRLELRFASFTEAAQVVDVLHSHVSQMKSRREPTGDDLMLEIVRQKRRKHQEKVAKAEERKAKRAARKAESLAAAEAKRTAKKALAGGDAGLGNTHLSYRLRDDEDEDDLVDEDEEDEDEEEEEEEDDQDENEDMYFASEEEAERALSAEQRALRDVPRPFDVTFNRLPREKNKHMYV